MKTKLTCNDKSVHFSHHQTLISQLEWLATFVGTWSHKDANSSHGLRVWSIVDVDSVYEWTVLQMSESGEYAAARHEIQATREIDIRLLPECLEWVYCSTIWLHLCASDCDAWIIKLLRWIWRQTLFVLLEHIGNVFVECVKQWVSHRCGRIANGAERF